MKFQKLFLFFFIMISGAQLLAMQETFTMSREDAAKLLEVSPVAPVAVIKKAYHAKAKLFHPDAWSRNKKELIKRKFTSQEQVQEHFKKISEAYERLSIDEDPYEFVGNTFGFGQKSLKEILRKGEYRILRDYKKLLGLFSYGEVYGIYTVEKQQAFGAKYPKYTLQRNYEVRYLWKNIGMGAAACIGLLAGSVYALQKYLC